MTELLTGIAAGAALVALVWGVTQVSVRRYPVKGWGPGLMPGSSHVPPWVDRSNMCAPPLHPDGCECSDCEEVREAAR